MARDYETDINGIINKTWDISDGYVVPSTESVKLAGGAKRINATFLYSDLANSSKIAKQFDRRVAAKIFKSFLQSATHLVNENGGTVISFDGDRVLGVFMGDAKNSNAAKCGLKIRYVVHNIIRKKFEAKYPAVRDAAFRISHGTGIDTGEVLVVRGGVRGNSDLVSVGRAPNLAAKLSDIRENSCSTFITASVYNMLNETSKYGGTPKRNMWTKSTWNFLGDNMTIYKSSWHWGT